jgi:hypothetical protein
MYKIILCLILFAFCTPFVNAQVRKMYGYYQPVSGGAKMSDDLTTNNSNSNDNNDNRYFIFAEAEKGKRFSFEELWINGHSYKYRIDTIKRLPHILRTSNGGELVFTDTLVRSAKGQVIQFKDLIITDAILTKNAKRHVTKTNVVIFYRYKGKLQCMSLKQLKPLRPLFTQ